MIVVQWEKPREAGQSGKVASRVFASVLYLAAYKAFSQTSSLSFTSTVAVGRYHLLLQMGTLR